MQFNDEIGRLTSSVIGAAIEVHRELGPGFLESVYEGALCIELTNREISFSRQHIIGVAYKGQLIGESRLDVFVESCLIVELKAVETILPVHKAQLLSYMKSIDCEHGLLINFNVDQLVKGIRRLKLT